MSFQSHVYLSSADKHAPHVTTSHPPPAHLDTDSVLKKNVRPPYNGAAIKRNETALAIDVAIMGVC